MIPTQQKAITSFSEVTNAEVLKFKKAMTLAATDFIASDQRPFEAISGLGLQRLIHQAMVVGSNLRRPPSLNQVEMLLPHLTTVSRNVSEQARLVRDELKLRIPKIVSGGCAFDFDLWKEDYGYHYLT